MKREVFKIIHPSRAFGTPWYFIRVIFYLLLMFSLQYTWAKYGFALTLAIALGIFQALIGLNVQHDANHGACSKMPWVNDLLGFGADLIGGCRRTIGYFVATSSYEIRTRIREKETCTRRSTYKSSTNQ